MQSFLSQIELNHNFNENNDEDYLFRQQLVKLLINNIRLNQWTQKEAAKKLNLQQPNVSHLLRGNYLVLSEKKLMHCLNQIGFDIVVNITPSLSKIGKRELLVTTQRE